MGDSIKLLYKGQEDGEERGGLPSDDGGAARTDVDPSASDFVVIAPNDSDWFTTIQADEADVLF